MHNNNETNHLPLKRLLAGNTIEYYDYIVYGLMTPVLSTLFFPSETRFVSLIQAFAVFACGTLVRPVSALFHGYIGDRYGRHKVLLLSSFITGIGTMGIGCLPTASTLDWGAPLLLVVMRIIQGFGMSAEFCSVLVYTGEVAEPNKRGFITSLSHSSAMLGTLLASAVVTLIFLLPEQNLYDWGWRIPFWFGAIICLNALILRRSLPASPFNTFHSKTRIAQQILQYRLALVRIFMVVAVNTLVYHLFFVFFSTHMIEMLNIAPKAAMLINSFNLIWLILFCAVGGWLGDRFGRKRIYLGCLLMVCLVAVPSYYMLDQSGSRGICFLIQFVFAIVGGSLLGVSSALYTELLPNSIRMTGTVVPYNLSIVVFGGTAPMVALFLIEKNGFSVAPGLYLSVVTALTILIMLSVPDNTGQSLQES